MPIGILSVDAEAPKVEEPNEGREGVVGDAGTAEEVLGLSGVLKSASPATLFFLGFFFFFFLPPPMVEASSSSTSSMVVLWGALASAGGA